MGILVLKYVRIPHFALNWNQKTHSEDFCSLLCAFTTAYFPLEQERQAIKLESVSSSYSKDLCYFSKIPITYWCINDTKTWMLPGATVLHYKGSSLLFQRCTTVKHQWMFCKRKIFWLTLLSQCIFHVFCPPDPHFHHWKQCSSIT